MAYFIQFTSIPIDYTKHIKQSIKFYNEYSITLLLTFSNTAKSKGSCSSLRIKKRKYFFVSQLHLIFNTLQDSGNEFDFIRKAKKKDNFLYKAISG